ncbi:hypothetical protein DFP72DRAFT_849999 [Ephemerocybe angulata]|uniref:Uncharacterized protein n=1 Tax=Ephemerocybe angulata TaxID=980116 RepID=A0A8H6HTV3_9AGAR|nr:hypothetical protein DFP72DRAFT_849999 [Tulosesus angulatus]
MYHATTHLRPPAGIDNNKALARFLSEAETKANKYPRPRPLYEPVKNEPAALSYNASSRNCAKAALVERLAQAPIRNHAIGSPFAEAREDYWGPGNLTARRLGLGGTTRLGIAVGGDDEAGYRLRCTPSRDLRLLENPQFLAIAQSALVSLWRIIPDYKTK